MSLNFIKAWRNDKLNDTINNKSFDLAFHFSFNQNKLWTNWRSNRALSYNKPSILYRTVGPVETNVFPDQNDFYRICPSDRHVWESLFVWKASKDDDFHTLYVQLSIYQKSFILNWYSGVVQGYMYNVCTIKNWFLSSGLEVKVKVGKERKVDLKKVKKKRRGNQNQAVIQTAAGIIFLVFAVGKWVGKYLD